MATEPSMKKQRLDMEQIPEIKYTKIFINNEWVDSGEVLAKCVAVI